MREMNVDKTTKTNSPIGTESTRFDACKLDAPLGLNLVRDSLSEPFHGPLGGAIDAIRRDTTKCDR